MSVFTTYTQVCSDINEVPMRKKAKQSQENGLDGLTLFSKSPVNNQELHIGTTDCCEFNSRVLVSA